MLPNSSLLLPSGFSDAANATPIPPSQDEWYSVPDGFEATGPGTILRIRIAQGNLTTIVHNATAAYNILYRTTDSRHQPSWSVTTLFIPKSFHLTPSGKRALVSYQFPYNTADVDSSPSYGFYNELSQPVPSFNMPAATDVLGELLARGWIVNSPDFEGPNAAYGAGVQAGQATLDSLRAVTNLANMTGLGDLSIVMWGYSGGSIATEAAAELQPQYAPRLSLSGAVIGGLADHLPTDFDLITKSPIAGHMVAILLGITVQYPEVFEYVRSRLKPETADEFLGVRHMASGPRMRFFASKDIYSYFIGGRSDLQAAPLKKVYYNECRLGHYGLPEVPMFFYKAIGDEYCPIHLTDDLVNRFCAAGIEITYERNTVGNHTTEMMSAEPRVFEWLQSIFKETYHAPAGGFLIRDVAVDLTGLPM
ncbi:LIP-domain-containing protein [Xylaria intraflava]|nr:LIP-domain-containing protein [Xylaria intraflava]